MKNDLVKRMKGGGMRWREDGIDEWATAGFCNLRWGQSMGAD